MGTPQFDADNNLLTAGRSAADTSVIYIGTIELTPKFGVINASSTGATEIISAVVGKKIRVLKWDLVCASAVVVTWQSNTGPTNITGPYSFAANGGIASSFCPIGHFETVAGNALDINLSGNVEVGGVLTYVEI